MEHIVVNNIDALRKYTNDKGLLEIVIRDGKKRYKTFVNVLLDNLQEAEQTEKIKEVYEYLKKNTDITHNDLSNISKLGKFNLLLSGADLVVSAVGFAIMYKKLNTISSKIDEIIHTVKEGESIQSTYEFKKVLSEYKNMLDCRKKQKKYSEDKMRELVDMEYNVLNLLKDKFLACITNNMDDILFCIVALAEMMAVSIRYFDEEYYFGNKDSIKEGNSKWHDAHDDWTYAFDELVSNKFIKAVQDLGIFELGLTTMEDDVFYVNYEDKIKSLKQSVEDNQALIEGIDDEELFLSIMNEGVTYIKRSIEKDVKAMDLSAEMYKDAVAIAVA